ncbi:hypothetical protein Leryth_003238 [Lithospermum erythrorhizon]|uniref:AP2/ERF domain-containing protein n=1 Tax=Lithospermum erythrorhizon TaxID=34254 RepID=A0AAV3RMK2_LITER|nr:hypothetical protein Leryth_003238 [Lithospermum erythrorhizon]
MENSILYSASSTTTTWSFDTTSSISDSDKEVTFELASSKPKRRAGRKKFKETRHPIYRGVRRRNLDKWVCELRDKSNKNKRIWLGTYSTAEMAARAHDVAALALRGCQNACLNFADSVWRLPVPLSSDAKDIREAAAEAAEAFRPLEVEEGGGGDDDHGVCDNECEGKKDEVHGKVNCLEVEVPSLSMLEEMEYGLLYSPALTYFDLVSENKFGSCDLASDVEVSLWNFSF